jgi:16S rRNA C967 or C1407 C5-methylase (RsmB/RsmF family)
VASKTFDQYYSEIYRDRWEVLKKALSLDVKVAFEPLNPSFDLTKLQRHEPGQVPERLSSGLLREYFMDPASILTASVLPVHDAGRVLDMCAAPGGKTLVLASQILQQNASAELIPNEVSGPRREALKKVLQNYIPAEKRQNFWVKGQDGVKYGLQQPESFDAILLDAPCSGEAHLLENKKELEAWSPKRSQGLSIKQYSLLSSAWLALKPGGTILYSTCSINPQENEGVIEKLIKKKGPQVQVILAKMSQEPERLAHGFQFFPDQFGFGPIYGCLMRKIGPIQG